MQKSFGKTLIAGLIGLNLYACSSDDAPTPAVTEQTPTPTPEATQSKVAFKQTECSEMLSADALALLTTGSTCGFLTVPEKHAINDQQASEKTIELAVVKLAARGSNKQTDPIVYLHGGPGGTAIADDLAEIAPSVLTSNRDVYLVDQRGVGLSKPALTCSDYKGKPEQLAACKKTLTDSGVELSAYNSLQSAWDFIEMRKALDIEQWNLFGGSYGTRLATTIMRENEQGIRSVVLDGMFPIEVNGMSENSWAVYETLNQILRNCETSEGCEQQLLKAKIEKIVSDLQNQNKMAQSRAFIQGLLEMISDPNLLTNLNQIGQNLDGIEVNSLENGLEEGFFYAMGLSVVCAEEYPFLTQTAFADRNDQGWTDTTRSTVTSIYHLGFTPEACRIWDIPAADNIETQAVTSNLPLLILNGKYDAQTPPAWGQLVANNMSMSQIYTNPRGGHGQLGEHDCFDTIISEFIQAPTQKVNDACIGDIQGVIYTAVQP